MAKSTAGKWVSRVGSSGGGKAYKKSRPSNYYGILVVIVVLGIAATLLARYDNQHPASAAKGTPPAVGTTWYAGLSIESCGVVQPALTPDPKYPGGLKVQDFNVIKIAPVSSADAGDHATVAQFANEFPGLIVSSTQLAVPNAVGVANPKTTWKNGDSCPSTSKYAGQTGYVSYAYWKFGSSTPTITTDPSSIKFSEYLRVTMAFEPKGVKPQAPSQTTYNAMVKAGTTPTTVAPPSTFPVVTTPTIVGSTTSVAVTTTTAPKG